MDKQATITRFIEVAKDARKTLRRWKASGLPVDLLEYKRGQISAYLFCARSIKGYETQARANNHAKALAVWGAA